MADVKTKQHPRIEPTIDGFWEVWRGEKRVSGEHPFVSKRMAEGWMKQLIENE